MPPSPALRCSPGKELPGKKHRRGHSIEYGTLFRDKEDEEDLALFSELQEKERDDFLLQSSDDLEDAFSTKLKHFSEFTIPIQGESSRLLSAEEDKNDYDWLLTPPDTPLFPSLDDEPQAATSVGTRGRPQSQKTSLSRSSTMEKRRRSSKGSPSPNRLSTSPRADNMQQMRGRPSSSARHPSPASGQRSVTPPVRRISPSPGKQPSGPVLSRSSTPTSRRMSTGSTTTTAAAPPPGRGTSPVKSSRGSSHSPSPKIKFWQSNIPGFSLDAPPNLRTSLGDRPASYVRGSSPASRNGRDVSSSTRSSRQSVSPSASRSVGSSSHSHEDLLLHPIQSVPVGSSERAAASKRASLSPNSRTSRSSSKLQSPGSSAPRRPFESALRQMDHPKSMFRPLASSLPSTGIYSGKSSSSSSSYHHIMLRHSSATTVGSNSSSSQVIGFMPDTKGSDPVPVSQSELEKIAYPDVLNEGSRHEESHESSFSDQLGDIDQGFAVESESSVNEEVNHHHIGHDDFLEGADLETMEVCGRCGSHYRAATETTRSEINICPDCREEHGSFVETDEILQSQENFDEKESFIEKIPAVDVLESLPVSMVEAKTVETRENMEQCDDDFKEQEQNHLHESSIFKGLGEQDESSTGCGGLLNTEGAKDIQSKIGSSEGGRGVPLLIKRSVSMKSPMTQASNNSTGGFTRSYDGFSYLRDKSMSLRSSSTETTYGSSIRKGSHVRHQSGSTLDMETHRYDTTNSKFMSSMSSTTSGVSSQALNVVPADSFEVCAAAQMNDETHQESHPELRKCKETNVVLNADLDESDGSIGLYTNVAEPDPVIIENVFGENGDGVDNNTDLIEVEISESQAHVRSTSEVGGASTATTDDCSLYDQSKIQEKDVNETPHHGHGSSTTTTASEIEPEGCEPETPPGLGVHVEISEPEENVDALDDDDDCSEKSMAHASVDHHHSYSLAPPVNEISDESTVLVECPGQKEPKSLTLEEATDAILFCSSIVHDLVYQAASIAMDKARDVAGTEEAEEEKLRPTVTVLGKLNANRSSGGGAKTKKKQCSKSAKASRKQMETGENIEEVVHIENDENAGEAAGMISNVGVLPSNKADHLKPPPPKLENKCNCSIM